VTANDDARGLPSRKHLLTRASDETLIAAAKNGGKLAFTEICNRYSELAFRMIYRVTKNQEDAEDALQETLLSAYKHLRSFEGRSKFSTWLTRIAINSALVTLRKRRRRPEISIDERSFEGRGQPLDLPDQTTDAESRPIEIERVFHLNQAVLRLRPALREIIEIQSMYDGTIKEIADAAGISVAATKTRLMRARVALRRALNDYGRGEKSGTRTWTPHRKRAIR
jgi:RNA polymerase sigma factor (sigma-70 family)